MEIEFHPLADKEVRKSHRWYLKRSTRAAKRFLEALERAVAEIIEAPERWPGHLSGTRFRRLRRFPYFIVYLQMAAKIFVIAVPHNRRRPGYWKRRI